jgi:diguanylate cyclase (GGDEF)-like protein
MGSVRYGIAAVLLCGIVVLIARMEVTTWMDEAAALGARQDLISARLLELRNLQDGLLDLETGQRGYLLSGEDSYLEPYADGRRNFEAALSRLQYLFRDNPRTLEEVNELATLGRAKAAEIEYIIQLRRDNGLAAVLAAAHTHEDQRTTNEIRSKVRALVAQLEQARSHVIIKEVARYRKISTLGLEVNALILLLIVVGIGFLALSIRRLEELQRQRESEAMHDALTGLPNRRYLREWLNIALAAADRSRRPLALLYFDLDGFKAVNDRFGHEAGDRVLQAVASRLRRLMRASDFVARLGGDEFVAALPDAPPASDISAMTARMQENLQKAPIPELADGAVTISIGTAFYPDDGADVAELLAVADRAMYEVKQNRRVGQDANLQVQVGAEE